jgi:coenzyme F420-reducing hydrogenase gamma subunit
MKTRVAVFAFTSCEGCSLVLLSMEDELPGILDAVEFVNFREAIDDRRDDYDIAIIDGAITRQHEVEELKRIRERTKTLIAMGACAVQGGLYYLREYHDPDYAKGYVYGEAAAGIEILPVRPLSSYVEVDHNLYGCPIDKREFMETLRSLIAGKRPYIPDYPVCNECRSTPNICVFERGMTCLGPVTRAGCGAICPAHGSGCCGCRGLVDEPMLSSLDGILKRHGMDDEEITARLRLFNGYLEKSRGKP